MEADRRKPSGFSGEPSTHFRKKYPDHPKYQRWMLDEVHAADAGLTSVGSAI